MDQKLLEPVCTYCKKPLFTVGTYLFSIDSIGNGISLLEIQYILLEVKHDYNKSYPFWSMFPTESAFSRYLFLCFQIFLLFSGTNFNKSYWNFSSHYWKTLSFNMGLLNSSSPYREYSRHFFETINQQHWKTQCYLYFSLVFYIVNTRANAGLSKKFKSI